VEDFPEYVVEEHQAMFTSSLNFVRQNFPDKIKNKISPFFIHTVSSAYRNILVEFLSHDIPHDEIVKYMDEMIKYSYNGFIGLMRG